MKRVDLRLTDKMVAQLDDLCAELGVNRSTAVRLALIQFIRGGAGAASAPAAPYPPAIPEKPLGAPVPPVAEPLPDQAEPAVEPVAGAVTGLRVSPAFFEPMDVYAVCTDDGTVWFQLDTVCRALKIPEDEVRAQLDDEDIHTVDGHDCVSSLGVHTACSVAAAHDIDADIITQFKTWTDKASVTLTKGETRMRYD